MDTRDKVGVRTSEPDVVVSSPVLRVESRGEMTPERSRGARWSLALGVALLLVAAAVGIGIAAILAGGDAEIANPASQQPADVPAPPAALAVTVVAPASATVGEPVDFTVTYTDGSGIFAGTVEEWGDGVGTSSLREGACSAAGDAAGPLTDTYQVSHTWTEPGTYTLVLGVHSYTCRGSSAVEETAKKSVTLQVLAR